MNIIHLNNSNPISRDSEKITLCGEPWDACNVATLHWYYNLRMNPWPIGLTGSDKSLCPGCVALLTPMHQLANTAL